MNLSKHTDILLLFVVGLLIGMPLLTVAEKADDSFLQQSFGDFKEDLQTARSEKKKGIMLFFEQDDCPFCHRMKLTVFNQVSVQQYYKKHFIVFTVDIEQTESITDFQGKPTTQKKFFETIARNRGATPVIAFFDLNGKLVTRYTGATANADEFIWLGEYVANRVYEKMPFTRYKRSKRKLSQQ